MRRVLRSALAVSRGAVALFIVIGVARSFLDTFGVSLFQRVLDGIAAGHLAVAVVLAYAAVLTVSCGIAYAEEWPKTRLDRSLYYFFKERSLAKAETIDCSFYMKQGTGKLLQQIEAGAVAGKEIILDFGLRVVREVMPSVLFGLYFISTVDARIVVYVAIGYIGILLASKAMLKKLYSIKESVVVNEEGITRWLARVLTELVTFRVLGKVQSELRDVRAIAAQNTRQSMRMVGVHEFFFAFFALLMIAVKVSIVGAYAKGLLNLSVGEVVALLLYLDRVYNPIAVLNVIYVHYRLNHVTLGRLCEYLEGPDDRGMTGEAEAVGPDTPALLERIELVDVSLDLDGKRILSEVSLAARRGEMVGVVGPSGAGKSTIVKLLLGLLKPTRGRVDSSIGDLGAVRLPDFYKRVVYVSQEPPIFDGSIRENLGVNEACADEEIMAGLDSIRLGDLVRAQPMGLDAQVGERGLLISGGERQRIALARVLFSECDLVLLDEATSALDAETEEIVLEAIRKACAKRIVVVVTHRLRAISQLSRIYAVNDGRLAETGSAGGIGKR
jgi:ABC-type multidrug transport system fused ATPase/permease subunit